MTLNSCTVFTSNQLSVTSILVRVILIAEKPSFYKLTEKGKWEAWNKQKGKSQDQAKHEYVTVCVKYFPDELKQKYSS
jgi:hypothetical protein